MNMIEKVARAIHTEDTESEWPENDCECCIRFAKVAIAAMREPTEEMEKIGNKVVFDWIDAKNTYQKMIDVALKE